MTHDDLHPEDPLPALLAQIDQSIALVPQLARWASALYGGFIDEGFSEAQALYLAAVQLTGKPGATP